MEFGTNQMQRRLGLGQHYGVRDKSDVEAQLGSAWINIVEFGTNQMRWRLGLGQNYGVRDKSDAVEAQLGSTLWSSGQIRCRGGSAWINIMEFGINQMR